MRRNNSMKHRSRDRLQALAQNPEVAKIQLWTPNSISKVLSMGVAVLEGDLAARQGQHDRAVAYLGRGVGLEDRHSPAWSRPFAPRAKPSRRRWSRNDSKRPGPMPISDSTPHGFKRMRKNAHLSAAADCAHPSSLRSRRGIHFISQDLPTFLLDSPHLLCGPGYAPCIWTFLHTLCNNGFSAA